jgi:hypothetical protein
MTRIKTLSLLAAVAALAFSYGGPAAASEGAISAAATGGGVVKLLATADAPGEILLVRSGHKGSGGGKSGGVAKSFGGSKPHFSSGPRTKHSYSPSVRMKSGKSKSHRSHNRHRGGGGIWWGTPLLVAPYFHEYGYDESDYDSCYWNCRRIHSPSYCRAKWWRYCD